MHGDPQHEAHSIPVPHLHSSHWEMPALVEPAGTPWCWGLGGLEPTVMAPICPSAPGLLESLQWLQPFGIESLVRLHRPSAF